MSVNSFPDCM